MSPLPWGGTSQEFSEQDVSSRLIWPKNRESVQIAATVMQQSASNHDKYTPSCQYAFSFVYLQKAFYRICTLGHVISWLTGIFLLVVLVLLIIYLYI